MLNFCLFTLYDIIKYYLIINKIVKSCLDDSFGDVIWERTIWAFAPVLLSALSLLLSRRFGSSVALSLGGEKM